MSTDLFSVVSCTTPCACMAHAALLMRCVFCLLEPPQLPTPSDGVTGPASCQTNQNGSTPTRFHLIERMHSATPPPKRQKIRSIPEARVCVDVPALSEDTAECSATPKSWPLGSEPPPWCGFVQKFCTRAGGNGTHAHRVSGEVAQAWLARHTTRCAISRRAHSEPKRAPSSDVRL